MECRGEELCCNNHGEGGGHNPLEAVYHNLLAGGDHSHEEVDGYSPVEEGRGHNPGEEGGHNMDHLPHACSEGRLPGHNMDLDQSNGPYHRACPYLSPHHDGHDLEVLGKKTLGHLQTLHKVFYH